MKKLLQWFAPIPFIVIAFGWGHNTGSAGNPEDTTTYFYGTGIEDNPKVEKGAQNNMYNLIGVEINKISDTDVRFLITETFGHQIVTGSHPVTIDAAADAVWHVDVTGTDPRGILGSDLINNGWKKDNTDTTIVNETKYTNEGDDLMNIYDVVEVEFDKYDDKLTDLANKELNYEVKSTLNTPAEWTTDMAKIHEYLEATYSDCSVINGVVGSQIKTLASNKDVTTHVVPNTSLINADLYIAAALTVAQEAC